MSFMKKVAKIAAPFASLIPGVGPLVGMGLGALGSIGGGGSSKGQVVGSTGAPTATNLISDPAFLKLLRDSIGASNNLIGQGQPMIGQGSGYQTQAGDYLSSILKGGTNLDKAMAGPISDLKTGARANINRIATTMPRASVAGLLGNYNADLGGKIAKLRYGAQSEAGMNLAGIGRDMSNTGANMMQAGTANMQDIIRGILGQNQFNQQQSLIDKQMHQQTLGGLGEGIGNILGVLLRPGGLLNKTKTKSTPVSPSPNKVDIWS